MKPEPQTLRQLFESVVGMGVRWRLAEAAGDPLKAAALLSMATRQVGLFLTEHPEQTRGWETLVGTAVFFLKSQPPKPPAGRIQ